MSSRLESVLQRLSAGGVQALTGEACGLQGAMCAQCHGKGYTLAENGPYVAASPCKCVSACQACGGKAMLVRNGVSTPCRSPSVTHVISQFNRAKLPTRYLEASFDSFHNFSGNGAKALRDLRRWFEAATTQQKAGASPLRRGLVLGGPIGVGKTFLLVAIAKAAIERGYSVRFTDFFQLLSELKAAYSDGEADLDVLQPLIEPDILIVDELGKGRNTDWERTIADSLISERYNQNKSIIASTNYLLNSQKSNSHAYNIDLEREINGASRGEFSSEQFGSLESRLGRRVYSRLAQTADMMELTGDDFRLAKATDHGLPAR